MSQPSPAPGWYPDPADPGKQIYWDGNSWSSPAGAVSTGKSNLSKGTAIAIGVCVLAGIGLMMSMQSASLLTGTGSLWTGVGIVGAGTAVAFFMGAAKWVRIVAAICLALALTNVVYMEKQLSDKRAELSQIFNN